MHIVFDLDNTLVDGTGKTLRPGIRSFLQRLIADGHTLSLWTNSPGFRAIDIVREHELRSFFSHFITRDDYDPGMTGRPKDIREIAGDMLIDDDPDEIRWVNSIGKKGFLIKPYKGRGDADMGELKKVYAFIRARGRKRFLV